MASTGADPPPRRSSPAGWLSAYDEFITKNVGQVSQIESTLRSLTYVIPGRFRDAEIASEAIHSGVQLLSLYHDLLLMRTMPSRVRAGAATGMSSGPVQAPSQHTRYTRYWTHKSAFYRRVAIVLQVVRYTELLCEMAAKRRGEKVRWRVVVLIEAAKALCRLLLLRVTGGRTTVTPPLPVRQPLPEAEGDEEEEEEYGEDEREERAEKETTTADGNEQAGLNHPVSTSSNPTATKALSPQPPLSPPLTAAEAPKTPTSMPSTPVLGAAAVAEAAAAGPPSPPATERPSPSSSWPSPHKQIWAMPRTGLSLPPLPQPGDITGYLLSRVLTADDIKPATKLLNRSRGPAAQAAEVLHILVPLVYAVALARTATAASSSSSKKSRSSASVWAPWLAGLAVDMAARQLRDHDSLRTTTLEREEWTRRGWAMGWWTMRGAFYEQAMKGVVAGVRSRLPGFVGGILEDYEYLWENYYFSTSP